MPTILHASVSPTILTKVDRLFTNRLDDLFIELFQNARRAAATRIDVTTRLLPAIEGEVSSKPHIEITVTDNGTGIADFSTLLCLGNSNWDADVSEREDAAGMGFFSLVHSGVDITSLWQHATFTKESFLGRADVEVTDLEVPVEGTRLLFRRAESLAAIEEAVKRIACFGHTPCLLNGSEVELQDFLKGAVSIKEVNGVRIGVFANSDHLERWNFHGRLIRASTPLLECVGTDGKAQTLSLFSRFDVLETRAIRLKLPDRSALVEDELFHAMEQAGKLALYEHLATLPDHNAPFSMYEEAHSLGVDLKEASPWFRSFRVETAGDDEDSGVLTYDRTPFLAEPLTCAIVDCGFEPGSDCAFTFAVAVEYFQKLALKPIQDDARRYRGYSWYSALPRYHSFAVEIDGVDAGETTNDQGLTLVDKIELSFELTGQEEPFVWSLPFAGWQVEDYGGEMTMFTTTAGPWTQPGGGPFSLVDAAVHLAFTPSDDFESDSYETQMDTFVEEWTRSFIRVLGGINAELKHEIEVALRSYPLSSLLKEAGIRQLQLTLDSVKSGWDLVLLPAA